MMGEFLKQIYDFQLKIFDQKFCKALVDAPIRFLITQKRFKNKEDMELELGKGLELFFQKD